MSLNDEQIKMMFELQNGMNKKVNPDWLNAGYPFLRAVVVEGSEGIEHHGYKWWKAQEKNLEQLKMELVDIWHFMLSHILVHYYKDHNDAEDGEGAYIYYAVGSVVSHMQMDNFGLSWSLFQFDGKQYDIPKLDTLEKLELLIGLSVSRRIFIPLFCSLMEDCGMDWEDLFRQYISKNVLNMFRQDHGYKQGTYLKIWGGREDNEHLVELINTLNATDPQFKTKLYDSLQQRYQKLQVPQLAQIK